MRHTVTVTVRSASQLVDLDRTQSSEGFDLACSPASDSVSPTEHARLLAMALAGAAAAHPEWCSYSIATLLTHGMDRLRAERVVGDQESEIFDRLHRASADLVALWDARESDMTATAEQLRTEAEHGDPSDNGRSKKS